MVLGIIGSTFMTQLRNDIHGTWAAVREAL
jgi:hypothetical protein